MGDNELHALADRYLEAHRRGKAPPLHTVMAAAGDERERLADLIELRLALSERPLLDNEADVDAVAAVMRGSVTQSTDAQPGKNVVALDPLRRAPRSSRHSGSGRHPRGSAPVGCRQVRQAAGTRAQICTNRYQEARTVATREQALGHLEQSRRSER